jgi:hypothetical protein
VDRHHNHSYTPSWGAWARLFFRSGSLPFSEEAAQPGYEPAKPRGQRDRKPPESCTRRTSSWLFLYAILGCLGKAFFPSQEFSLRGTNKGTDL